MHKNNGNAGRYYFNYRAISTGEKAISRRAQHERILIGTYTVATLFTSIHADAHFSHFTPERIIRRAISFRA